LQNIANRIAQFISNHVAAENELANQKSRDYSIVTQDYADTAAYFDTPKADHRFIENDKRTYFNYFSSGSEEVVSKVSITDNADGTYLTTFTSRVNRRGSHGSKYHNRNNALVSNQYVIQMLPDGEFKIVGQKITGVK